MEIIKEYECKIKSGEIILEKLVKIELDCSLVYKDGNFGWFGMGIMQLVFQDVVFKLQFGEMSGVVDIDSGFYFIYW